MVVGMDGMWDVAGCGGTVVVGRKEATWQRLNRHYSIWDDAGRAAAVGNIIPVCQCPIIVVVVQLARALHDPPVCSGVQFPNNALFAFYYYYLLLNTIIEINISIVVQVH